MVINDKAAAMRRASKALSNAKQRCTNKKNPDYPNYGGAGIQVLFKSANDLVDAIGLPAAGHSLDRIDPTGHYEVGNVRWTTPAVQAANKKGSAVNYHLSMGAQIAAAKEAVELRASRKVATVGWVRTITAYNAGHMPRDQAMWMAEHLTCSGLIESGFDFNTAFDHTHPPPSFIHLPALSVPKARIRLRCGPAARSPALSSTVSMGRLSGLEKLAPEWNIPKIVWDRVRHTAEAGGAGVAYYGMPTLEDLLGGWIEGSFLAAASCLAACGVSAACYPLLRVNRMVSDLPSPDWWEQEEHQLLNAAAIFIPDLTLDCGVWGEGAQVVWWKIAELLRWRLERNLSTFVGLQNPNKLPAQLREVILAGLEVLRMPATPVHDLAPLAFEHQSFEVPDSSVTLREMAADKQLRRLVTHSGLVGT